MLVLDTEKYFGFVAIAPFPVLKRGKELLSFNNGLLTVQFGAEMGTPEGFQDKKTFGGGFPLLVSA